MPPPSASSVTDVADLDPLNRVLHLQLPFSFLVRPEKKIAAAIVIVISPTPPHQTVTKSKTFIISDYVTTVYIETIMKADCARVQRVGIPKFPSIPNKNPKKIKQCASRCGKISSRDGSVVAGGRQEGRVVVVVVVVGALLLLLESADVDEAAAAVEGRPRRQQQPAGQAQHQAQQAQQAEQRQHLSDRRYRKKKTPSTTTTTTTRNSVKTHDVLVLCRSPEMDFNVNSFSTKFMSQNIPSNEIRFILIDSFYPRETGKGSTRRGSKKNSVKLGKSLTRCQWK